jgi:hypothetical protein
MSREPSPAATDRRQYLRRLSAAAVIVAAVLPGALTSCKAGGRSGAATESATSGATPLVVPDAAALEAAGVCSLPCQITGTVRYNQPAWGPSTLITTLSVDEGTREGNIVAVDSRGKIRWRYRAGDWYELAPAEPAQDSTGHIFINYNPGRYNGVIILAPQDGTFADFKSLPPSGDYIERFYDATLVDVNDDGVYEVDASFNNCSPDCAGGTVTETVYRWNGTDYVPEGK